jgi:hypothetical protein
MKAMIKTSNAAAGWRFSRAVTSREDWSAESHDGGMDFIGSGSTRTGRNVEVRVAFGEDGGEASIVLDAPDSKGGLLATVLEEVFGQSVVRRDTAPGDRPTELPPQLAALAVEVDGERASWQCVPCAGDAEHPETATTWWWTVAL